MITKFRGKNHSVVLSGHVTESYGPMQALPDFLLNNFNSYAIISHPFPYSTIPCSTAVVYRKRKQLYRLEGPKYKTMFLVHYFGDVLLTLYFFLRFKKKWDLFIGCDCLNAFTGILLRKIRVVNKVIFYENEFTVQRFRNVFLNKIFHSFNIFVAQSCDLIWDSPPNIEKIRKKQGVTPRKIIKVPHGVDLKKIVIPKNNNLKELVYVGHVTNTKGLDLIVEVLSEIKNKKIDFKVSIIGSGPFEQELKKMVDNNGLKNNFIFWGYTDHDWTLSYLPSCGIGLAPYTPLYRQALMYAEPLKVKDYLSCGLPVIISDFGSFASEIQEKKLGVAIGYNKKEVKQAILKLLTDKKFYQQCRKNVLSYKNQITWDQTYKNTFEKTFSYFSL